MMAPGMKQKTGWILMGRYAVQGVVSAGHSYPCLDLFNPYLKGESGGTLTELARLENPLDQYKHMVLLDAPNSPAHLEKQGVELGDISFLLQRPSLPHY